MYMYMHAAVGVGDSLLAFQPTTPVFQAGQLVYSVCTCTCMLCVLFGVFG